MTAPAVGHADAPESSDRGLGRDDARSGLGSTPAGPAPAAHRFAGAAPRNVQGRILAAITAIHVWLSGCSCLADVGWEYLGVIEAEDHGDGTTTITFNQVGPTTFEPLLNHLMILTAARRRGACVAMPAWSRRGHPGMLMSTDTLDARAFTGCVNALYGNDPGPAVQLAARFEAQAARDEPRATAYAKTRLALPSLPGLDEARARGIHVRWATEPASPYQSHRVRPEVTVTLSGYEGRAASIAFNARDISRPPASAECDQLLLDLFQAVAWQTSHDATLMTGDLAGSEVVIGRVRAAHSCHVAMCLVDLWSGETASTQQLLAWLETEPPDIALDRWLDRSVDTQQRAEISERWNIAPVVLPGRAGPGLETVPAEGSVQRRAAERIAMMFRRESAYDFAPYSAAEPGEQIPWLMLDDCVGRRVAVGCAGMVRRGPEVNLAWIWLHPYWRGRHGRGAVHQMLSTLDERYGAYGVEAPFSPAMRVVMERRGIAEDRWRGIAPR